MPETLRHLVSRLDAAIAAPPEELSAAVTAALGAAVATRDWLSPEQQRTDRQHYARHVLYADPQDRYTVVAIAWDRSQQSSIHAHRTWCGVAVYSGEITETYYAIDDGSGTPQALRTVRRNPGTLSFDQGGAGAHRIANIADVAAVSIHVYGVGAARIATDVNRVLG